MAIQDLEVVVSVNVKQALRSLKDLKRELESVADKISSVDRHSRVNVNTRVGSIRPELQSLRNDIESWEARNEINIRTDVDGLDLSNLDDIQIRDDRDALGGRDDLDVATMNVNAGVVNISGLSLDTLQERLRNGTREGFLDALKDQDVTQFVTQPRSPDDDDDDDDDMSFRRRMRQIRMDFDAGDIGLGRVAREVSDELGDVAANSKLTNLSMSDLHNAFARIVPLLITFVGTLPALIGAFVTLYAATIAAAGALMTLAGLGAIGFALEDGTTDIDTQRLRDALSNIRDEFLEAFAPIASRLEPLFIDALDGLELFFNRLANQGDALISLTDEARAFGGFVMDFVPMALRDLAAMVAALSDSFSGIGQFLMRNFTTIVRGMVDTFVQSLPAIAELLSLIAATIPPLIRMSIGFVRVTSEVFKFFGAIGNLIGMLGINAEALGTVIAATLTLLSATLILAGAFKVLSVTVIGKYLISAFMGLVKAIYMTTGATGLLNIAIATLISLLTLGLFTVVAAGILQMGSAALSTKSDVDALNDSLRTFDGLSSGMGGGFGDGPSGPSGAGASSSIPSDGGGMSMTYNDYGGGGDPDAANAYSQWRYERTTGDKA